MDRQVHACEVLLELLLCIISVLEEVGGFSGSVKVQGVTSSSKKDMLGSESSPTVAFSPVVIDWKHIEANFSYLSSL